MKIVAIGAHFDDIELGCGGALSKHTAFGDNIYNIVVTASDYKSEVNLHERDRNIAMREGNNAAQKLGARLICGEFPTLGLSPNKELINFLCRKVKEIDPDVVYTHFIGDQHMDHQAVAKASLIATRSCKHVYSYMSNIYGTMPVFNPNYFVCIDNYIEQKLELIHFFRSEIETHPNWDSYVREQASYYGIRIGCNCAEAFVVIRSVW